MGRVREMQTDPGRYIGRDVRDVGGGNGRTVARRSDNRVKEDERGMKFLFLSRAFITSGVYFGGLSFPFASLPLSLFLTSCTSHRVNSFKKSNWFPHSNCSLLEVV